MLKCTLFIMTVLTIISIILKGTFGGLTYYIASSMEHLDDITDYAFVMDDFYMALSIIITIISIVAVLSLKFLGSGLSDSGIKTIMIITSYISIWILLTFYIRYLIIDIYLIGYIIYFLLTLLYTFGVVQYYSTSSSN